MLVLRVPVLQSLVRSRRVCRPYRRQLLGQIVDLFVILSLLFVWDLFGLVLIFLHRLEVEMVEGSLFEFAFLLLWGLVVVWEFGFQLMFCRALMMTTMILVLFCLCIGIVCLVVGRNRLEVLVGLWLLYQREGFHQTFL